MESRSNRGIDSLVASGALAGALTGALATYGVMMRRIRSLEAQVEKAKNVELELKECGIKTLSLKARAIEAGVDPSRKMETPKYRPSIADGELALYLHQICPFAHRAWWIAAEKLGVKGFRAIQVDLSNKPEWFEEIYHPKTVPAMQFGEDFCMGDSQPVCKWIDENMPSEAAKMTPSDPATGAAMEAALAKFGKMVVGPCYRLLKNKEPSKDEELALAVRAGANWFNEVLVMRGVGKGGAKYFNGDEICMFEILTATFFARFRHTLKHWRGFDIMGKEEAGDREALNAWMNAIEERPMFKHTNRSPEYYIMGYARYANNEVRTCAIEG